MYDPNHATESQDLADGLYYGDPSRRTMLAAMGMKCQSQEGMLQAKRHGTQKQVELEVMA